MSLEIQEYLAAIPAAAAYIHDFPGIARLKHKPFFIRPPENIQGLLNSDDPSKPVALVIVGPPAEHKASIHELFTPGAFELMFPSADTWGHKEFLLIPDQFLGPFVREDFHTGIYASTHRDGPELR